MGDPLSVSASVAALVTAGVQLTQILYGVGTAIRDAPQLAGEAADELNAITIVLGQLQVYISGKAQASIERRNLITVEHITATLTSCVITYSDLDGVLKSLHVEGGMKAWDRTLWYFKKDRINEIVQRLQNHKATLGLMLNILQCASLTEAETSMDRLCDKVNGILRANQDLSLRLRNMEALQAVPHPSTLPNAGSVSEQGDVQETQGAAADLEVLPSVPDEVAQRLITLQPASDNRQGASAGQPEASGDHVEHSDGRGRVSEERQRASNFEELLHRSRVYRHVDHGDDALSMISDARSTLALSICSSLTLGGVSIIAMIAIPVYAKELSNADCYGFEENKHAQLGTGTRQAITTQKLVVISPERRNWRAVFRRSPRAPKAEALEQIEGRVFGVPLHQSIRYANVAIFLFRDEVQSYIYGYVPIIVAKCGVCLKEEGTDCEHVFERAGSPKHVGELCAAFDSANERYGKDPSRFDGYTVFDAASVLLRYLLQLPEPVVPLSAYGAFRDPLSDFRIQVIGESGIVVSAKESSVIFDPEATITAYQHEITKLPPLNRQLLLYLLDLLAVFAAKSDLNKMTTPLLAALFQPGILAHPDHRLSGVDVRLSQHVLILLIENQDSFLIGMPA